MRFVQRGSYRFAGRDFRLPGVAGKIVETVLAYLERGDPAWFSIVRRDWD
jgi:hypothetical protein